MLLFFSFCQQELIGAIEKAKKALLATPGARSFSIKTCGNIHAGIDPPLGVTCCSWWPSRNVLHLFLSDSIANWYFLTQNASS